MRVARHHIPLGLVALLAAPLLAQTSGTSHDLEALAQKIVVDSARVKEGDRVMISGSTRDTELLENIAVHVRRLGAFPMVSLNTQRMGLLYFSKVPAKYDSQKPTLDLELARLFDVNISVDSSEALDAFSHVPPARQAALGQAYAPVSATYLERGVRSVAVGNELYPTASRAQLLGVSQQQLADSFWGGVNVDYPQLQATARAGIAVLSAGKELHVTNPNGTDLRMRIEGRKVLASDGVISDEDVKQGGAACSVYLPAGEVYVTPVPGTAEGKVVVDQQFFQGKVIPGFTLTVSGGKVVAMSARSGLEPLKAIYDAAAPGKEVLGFVDIGINPNVRYASGSRMLSWVPAGMVTVGLGDNRWAGGENVVPYGLNSYLPGSTVKVDGRPLVENGTLKF
jgi:leucyl aminopeptidase (aminopeptidase T)